MARSLLELSAFGISAPRAGEGAAGIGEFPDLPPRFGGARTAVYHTASRAPREPVPVPAAARTGRRPDLAAGKGQQSCDRQDD